MSLLRELVDEVGFREKPAHALLEAALLVRRAGLEHLVLGPTRAEVLALAQAGEAIAKERVALLLAALENAPAFLADFDGGARARNLVMEAALELSKGGV
jgi:hypothetical protein